MKKIWIGLLFLMAFFSVVSCEKKSSVRVKQDPSLARMLLKKQFVVGVGEPFAPLSFPGDDGNYIGYDIDLVRSIADSLKLELVLVQMAWNDKEDLLYSGKIDCIASGLSYTPERAESMALTGPYLRNSQVVVVLDSSPYKTLESLSERKLGMTADFFELFDSVSDLKNFLDSVEVVEFDSSLALALALEKGQIEAFVSDFVVAYHQITDLKQPFKILPEALSLNHYVLGFRKYDLTLRDEVQECMETLDKRGVIPDISEKWFGANISVITGD